MMWRNYILSPVNEITAPTAPIIDVDEAKEWLKISYDAEDDLLTSLIDAATTILQKGLSLSLGGRQLQINITHSGCIPFKLPYGPVITLDEVMYRNCNCLALPFVTADATTYGMIGDYLSAQAGYYQIKYTAGPYPDPEAAKTMVKQQVAYMFENRGDALQGKINPDLLIQTVPLNNNEWI